MRLLSHRQDALSIFSYNSQLSFCPQLKKLGWERQEADTVLVVKCDCPGVPQGPWLLVRGRRVLSSVSPVNHRWMLLLKVSGELLDRHISSSLPPSPGNEILTLPFSSGSFYLSHWSGRPGAAKSLRFSSCTRSHCCLSGIILLCPSLFLKGEIL